MRTIAIEEHFLANVFVKMQERAHHTSANGPNRETTTPWHAKLQDLGALRLQEMDASGIDLQVISHTTEGIVPSRAPKECDWYERPMMDWPLLLPLTLTVSLDLLSYQCLIQKRPQMR